MAFEVVSVTQLTGFSSGSLPAVRIRIMDAMNACNGTHDLLLGAPVPTSSSVPFNVVP